MIRKKGNVLEDPIFCLCCNEYRTHTVIASGKVKSEEKLNKVSKTDKYDDNGNVHQHTYEEVDSVSFVDFWSQVIACKKCSTTSLMNIQQNDRNEIPDDVKFIPPRPKIEEKYKSLPDDVFVLYKEVEMNLVNGLLLSCAFTLRSLLERICLDRKYKQRIKELEIPNYIGEYIERKKVEEIKKRHLDEYKHINFGTIDSYRDKLSGEDMKKIERRAKLGKQVDLLVKDMKKRRPGNSKSFEVLTDIVKWGNENVHSDSETKLPTIDEIEEALSMIKYLFHAIYIDEMEEQNFHTKASNFKSRRNQ